MSEAVWTVLILAAVLVLIPVITYQCAKAWTYGCERGRQLFRAARRRERINNKNYRGDESDGDETRTRGT